MRSTSRRGSWASVLALPLAAGIALAALGCGDATVQLAEDAAPSAGTARQLVFVYDRSTSITGGELVLYQRLTDQVLEYLDHGDRVAALEMLQLSLEETPRRWAQMVPQRRYPDSAIDRDEENRLRFLRDVRDYLRAYTDPEGREDHLGTDILSTLYDVAAEVRGYPQHQSVVVLFSDMLQATEEINMEDMIRMPPADWIAQHAADGRLPDLTGACILVAGARTDTVEGQAVKTFWQDYFTATGATLLDHNYAYRPVRLPEDPC